MATTNKLGQHLVTQDFLAALERMGWPKVDVAKLSSATIRRGELGGSQEAWEAFAHHAPLAQQRHIRMMLEYNPSIFVRDTPDA